MADMFAVCVVVDVRRLQGRYENAGLIAVYTRDGTKVVIDAVGDDGDEKRCWIAKKFNLFGLRMELKVTASHRPTRLCALLIETG